MRTTVLTCILAVSIIYNTRAQQSGEKSYQFLNVPISAFLSGVGGINISRNERENNLFTSNPALVGLAMSRNLSLNYILYPGDIKISNITYTTDISNTGSWSANVVYFNYGSMDAYDDTGASIGEINASDYALSIGKSHRQGNFRVGANMKFAVSDIATYKSSALLFDLGGVFIHPQKDFTVGMVFRNLGVVLQDYTSDTKSSLPFDARIGTSFKPEHMPFRFSLSIYDLVNWSQTDELASIDTEYQEPTSVDKVFRHTIWSTEIIIGKYVNVLIGYNHRRRKELKLQSSSSGSGFSYGIMVAINAFEFGFSRATYHVAGASNTFTLTTGLSNIIKKKKLIEN